MLSRFFIENPIFASVISIVIVMAGAVSVGVLPIAQYPDITPPTVEVKATYPGANASVVAETVASPIEQAVIGVEIVLPPSGSAIDILNDHTLLLNENIDSYFIPGLEAREPAPETAIRAGPIPVPPPPPPRSGGQ